MNNELTYAQVLDLLPAYVLGALEPEEMLAVDAYLRKHQALFASLRESEEAATQLAYLAPTEPLPAGARERLLRRARAEVAGPAPPLKGPTAQDAGPGRVLSNLWAVIRTARISAAATAVLILGLLAVSLYAGQMQARLGQSETQRLALQAEVAQLQAANDQLQRTNQVLQQQLGTEQERLAFIASATPNRTVQLTGTNEAPGASGVFYFRDDRQGLLVLNGLQPLSAQMTYQLWLIPADETPVPAGLVDVQGAEPTWLSVPITPDAEDFAAVGVSVEPAGGSLAPTGPIVLLGTKG
jgi:anti-sigma-K factor RskA